MITFIRSDAPLAATPIHECVCGHKYRGAVCPCCTDGVVHHDVPTLGKEMGGHNRASYPGERAPRRTLSDRQQQIEAVLTLMAKGMGKTKACEEVGIEPKTFNDWRAR